MVFLSKIAGLDGFELADFWVRHASDAIMIAFVAIVIYVLVNIIKNHSTVYQHNEKNSD